MTQIEMLVVVVGLAAGYWMVNFFLGGKKSANPEDGDSSEACRHDAKSSWNESADDTRADEAERAAAGKPWYEVLDISRDASVGEIRAAYKRQMSQYHPDKVASLGPELRDLAHRKALEIAQAYRMALAMRGESS